MVARITSGRSIRGALNYNEDKVAQGQAVFIGAENYLKESDRLSVEEKLFVLKDRAGRNERVKTNCVHISLNFESSEKIPAEKMRQIARDYMERIGFSGQPCLVYRHEDAGHPHLHIVSTNIKADGERISLHNLGRCASEKARQEIEVKHGLVQANGRGKDEEIPVVDANGLKRIIYGRDETKRMITQVVNTVVQKYNYSSLQELNAVLGSFNVLADRGHEKSNMFKQQGLLYRIIDEKGNKMGVPIRASRIAGNHTLGKLKERFEKNRLKRKMLGASLKGRIDGVLKNVSGKEDFVAVLKKQKIDVLFRTSKDGQVYGVTYIDHAGRLVINGSDLGKAYSAKSLLEAFKKQSASKPLVPLKEVRCANLGEIMTGGLKVGSLEGGGQNKKVGPLQNQNVELEKYLEPVPQTSYLDILLGKTETDHGPGVPRRKKKRKKRGQQTEQQSGI